MRTAFILTAIIGALTLTPGFSGESHAGRTSLKKGDEKLSLWCNGGGCYTRKTSSAGKGPKTRIGPGGSNNFRAQKAKFKKQGWK
jgi:hypothetical protein